MRNHSHDQTRRVGRIRRDYMWLTLRDRLSKGRIADPRRKCGELSE